MDTGSAEPLLITGTWVLAIVCVRMCTLLGRVTSQPRSCITFPLLLGQVQLPSGPPLITQPASPLVSSQISLPGWGTVRNSRPRLLTGNNDI